MELNLDDLQKLYDAACVQPTSASQDGPDWNWPAKWEFIHAVTAAFPALLARLEADASTAAALETAREALRKLYEACYASDCDGELDERINGDILDEARAALAGREEALAGHSKGRTVIVIDILGEGPDKPELDRLAENWVNIGMPRGKYELHPAEIERLTNEIRRVCAGYNKPAALAATEEGKG